jgi:uncharacterized RDD family membrane protein YckC
MNDWKARGSAWGSHVLNELQLSPNLIAVNARSPLLWRRVGAAVIDCVVLFCFFNMANQIHISDLNLTIMLPGDPLAFWPDLISPINALLEVKAPMAVVNADVGFDKGALACMFFSPVFVMLVVWLYNAVLESSPWRATLGKKICGVVVTGVDGERISFRRASLRNFAKSVTFLPYFILHFITDLTPLPQVPPGMQFPSMIGFALAFASARMQCLHDAIAHTLVQPASGAVTTTPPALVRKADPSSLEATMIDPQRMEATMVDPDRVQLPPQPVHVKPKPVEALMPPPPKQEVEDMKECPACAEWIKAKAKKCRYCQERFD